MVGMHLHCLTTDRRPEMENSLCNQPRLPSPWKHDFAALRLSFTMSKFSLLSATVVPPSSKVKGLSFAHSSLHWRAGESFRRKGKLNMARGLTSKSSLPAKGCRCGECLRLNLSQCSK